MKRQLKNMKRSGNQPSPTISLVTTKPIHQPPVASGHPQKARRPMPCPIRRPSRSTKSHSSGLATRHLHTAQWGFDGILWDIL